MSLRGGSGEAHDTVEVLPFLTRPATVRVTVGPSTTAHAAPAGVRPLLVPLRPGEVSAAVVRGGRTGAAVELPYRVVRHPEVQNLQYYAATSGRDTRPAAADPLRARPAPGARRPPPDRGTRLHRLADGGPVTASSRTGPAGPAPPQSLIHNRRSRRRIKSVDLGG
ncbi:hypothetical protein ACE14D_07835, partial [Streptomyces sp. Act-28]